MACNLTNIPQIHYSNCKIQKDLYIDYIDSIYELEKQKRIQRYYPLNEYVNWNELLNETVDIYRIDWQYFECNLIVNRINLKEFVESELNLWIEACIWKGRKEIFVQDLLFKLEQRIGHNNKHDSIFKLLDLISFNKGHRMIEDTIEINQNIQKRKVLIEKNK